MQGRIYELPYNDKEVDVISLSSGLTLYQFIPTMVFFLRNL